MSSRRILIDLGSLGASNALGKVLWAVSLMLMMRALGPERYGQLVVVWSLVGAIAPLTDLGLAQFLLREGARQRSQASSLLHLGLKLRLFFGLILACILLSASGISGAPGASLSTVVLLLAIAAPLIDGAFLTATASAQIEGRIAQLAAWRILGFLTLPLILLALLPRVDELGASAAAYAGASLLSLAGYFLTRNRTRHHSGWASEPITLQATLSKSRPFLFMGAAAIAYGKVDVGVLGLVSSEEAAGYYHAAYQVILLAFSLPEVLFTATFATLYRLGPEPDRLLARWPVICRVLCVVVVVTVPSLAVYAPEIMTLIGGASFEPAGTVLRCLLPMVLALPIAAAFNFLLLLDRPHERAFLDGCCVLATAVAIAIVSPRFGAIGAALAASAAYILACFLAWRRVSLAGLQLDWLADLGRALLISSPSMLLWLLPWPHWIPAALSQGMCAVTLLYAVGYVKPAELRSLAE